MRELSKSNKDIPPPIRGLIRILAKAIAEELYVEHRVAAARPPEPPSQVSD